MSQRLADGLQWVPAQAPSQLPLQLLLAAGCGQLTEQQKPVGSFLALPVPVLQVLRCCLAGAELAPEPDQAQEQLLGLVHRSAAAAQLPVLACWGAYAADALEVQRLCLVREPTQALAK